MRHVAWAALALSIAWCAGPARAASPRETWNGYLDYAYVYTSAEPEALAARLADYGREAGVPLMDFIVEHYEAATPAATGDGDDEAPIRRKAIAYLLDYLARSEPASLDRSVETIRELETRLGRHENRYWFHYILAHRALERGHPHDFTGEVLELLTASAGQQDDAWEERREALAGCIQELAPRARQILELRYAEKPASPPEIAERLAWTVNAVHVALARARKFLQDCTRRRLSAGEG